MKIEEFLASEQAKRAQKALEAGQAEKQDFSVLMELIAQLVAQNSTLTQSNDAMTQRVVALEARQPDVRTEIHELSVEPKIISDRAKGWDVTFVRGPDGLLTGMKMVAL